MKHNQSYGGGAAHMTNTISGTSQTLQDTIDVMMKTHPNPAGAPNDALMLCIEACITCATACTACADACLAEEHVSDLASCILMNTDCADICHATGQVLMRQSTATWDVTRRQLEACRTACARCAEMCEQHAAAHEHCRACAIACRYCEDACHTMLAALPA